MNIVGYGICGPGEADKYMEATMKEFARLCNTTVIVLNNATDKERKMVEKYNFTVIEDDREWGKEQWRIKQDLLDNHIAPLAPDWCVCLDMDEVFDPQFTRESIEELEPLADSIYFYFITLWNEGYRPDSCFWNIRAFRWTGNTEMKKAALHPGLAPKWAYELGVYSRFHVKHYGLMDKEDRDRKIARYEKYDPNAKYISRKYYDSLKVNTCTPLNIDVINQELDAYWKRYRPTKKKTITMEKKKKFVWLVREVDGVKVPIVESKVEETMARGGFKLADTTKKVKKEEPLDEGEKTTFADYAPGAPENVCEECNKQYKTPAALKAHNTRTHK